MILEKHVDINSWNRKNQFYFFKDYDNPFYNICTDVEITKFYQFIKSKNLSFFLSNLFLSIKAANNIEEFRYRIKGNSVIIFEMVNPSSTILNDDNTFKFCRFKYHQNFNEYLSKAEITLKEALQTKNMLNPEACKINVIHYSTIPWIRFNSISHARKYGNDDSIPKIVFGKFYKENSKIMLPVSIEVHHSLIDGYHVAEYLKLYQSYLEHPEENLLEEINE
ncbi:chloramphenicol acetyltransferase [bacterium BMS3Abin04]|nr:chloramphenicol acetyltransferase [bacterium BMS3Abin04]